MRVTTLLILLTVLFSAFDSISQAEKYRIKKREYYQAPNNIFDKKEAKKYRKENQLVPQIVYSIDKKYLGYKKDVLNPKWEAIEIFDTKKEAIARLAQLKGDD